MRQSVPNESTKHRRGCVIRLSTPILVDCSQLETAASRADLDGRQVNTRASTVSTSCFGFQAVNAVVGKHDLVQIAIGMAEVSVRDAECRT